MNSDLNQTLASGAPAYVLGVDAGGTRTRAVLADARDGRVLGEGVSGPGNALTVPVERVTEHLVEAIGEAVRGVPPGRVVAVAGGFAGAASVQAGAADEAGASEEAAASGEAAASEKAAASEEVAASEKAAASGNEPTSTPAPAPSPEEEPGRRNARTALAAALGHLGIPLPTITVHSDIEAAFAGAPGHPADGLALIAGTGSVAARVRGRVLVATSGGDGWLLGDDGSGFWIGRRAVRAALRAADGRDGPTSLVTLIGRALGVPEGLLPRDDDTYDAGEPPARTPAPAPSRWGLAQRAAYRAHLLPAVMERRPTDLAAHAPLVTRAADEGDEVARQILQEAAAALVETVAALAPAPGEPLVVTGGLLAPDGPLLAPLTDHLAPLGLTIAPVTDGSAGAVALARVAAGH